MDRQDVQTLIDYHYWARDRLLDALARLTPGETCRDLKNSFPSIEDTLRHLIGAEQVWQERWRGESPTTMPRYDGMTGLPAIRRAWAEQESRVREALIGAGDAGVARLVHYTGFTGQTQAQPFWQTLQHLVNHGTYHRGQVTTMMRQLGAEPPRSMDLIAFYREQGTVVK